MDGRFILTFGRRGTGYGKFNFPWDVAVNYECQIVVSDTHNHRIQLFSSEGIFVQSYGSESLASPCGVAFDTDGSIAVTDVENHQVVKINSFLNDMHVFKCDTDGRSLTPFRRPRGIAIDDEGNVVVADTKRHRIQLFNRHGELRWIYGTGPGSGESQLDHPAGVALCPDGRIAVVDSVNNRVVII